ncbi:extensin family protein [Rubellimicrobium sp. CFH 75288]|uniref:extensin-like domain-containing protein n=1 Tax=Rubellimicrobium sp. CFH 75288 TaxID=2697034 RepID=UPI0014121B7D|nr:hypothetical protein [Rubellimicrobium sp. CFH 75288]
MRLTGRRALVMAEMLMTEPPRPPVIVGGWAGETPPLRPSGAERRPDEAKGEAAPVRPRLRPRTPDDPAPPPPPEPDAPPAYRPGARPELRPEAPEYSPLAVASAVSPRRRPEGIVARAEQARAALVRGQVCGDPRLQGEVVAAIRGSGGCGIEEPVRLRSVDGVRLSQPALVDCPTATALLDWIGKGVRPALDGRGGGPVALEIMGHYVCRPRNNQAGQRLSEHGRGRAIDIGAVILADGTRLSVLRDGRDPAMRAMHRAACGIFSTTLGPGSDGFHEDHFHYDTARGRRPYCR